MSNNNPLPTELDEQESLDVARLKYWLFSPRVWCKLKAMPNWECT